MIHLKIWSFPASLPSRATSSFARGLALFLFAAVCLCLAACSGEDTANKDGASGVGTAKTRTASLDPTQSPAPPVLSADGATRHPGSPNEVEPAPAAAPPASAAAQGTAPGTTSGTAGATRPDATSGLVGSPATAGSAGATSVAPPAPGTTPGASQGSQQNPAGLGPGTALAAGTAASAASRAAQPTPAESADSQQQARNDALREYLDSAPTPETTPDDGTVSVAPTATTPSSESSGSSGSSGYSEYPSDATPRPTATRVPHPTPRPTVGTPTPAPPTPTPDPGEGAIYFFPDNFRVVPGEKFTVMVMIDAFEHAVSSYGIDVLYEPYKTRLDAIRNGDDPLLGKPIIKYVQQESSGQQLGAVHLLQVQTADMNRPIGTKIMVSRLDFTAMEPGETRIEIGGVDLVNTLQLDMRVTGQGVCRVTVVQPPNP